MNEKANDKPLAEVVAMCDKALAENPNVKFFQKFTCGSCGARQTIDEPNKFYTSGRCEECDSVTELKVCGCMMVAERN